MTAPASSRPTVYEGAVVPLERAIQRFGDERVVVWSTPSCAARLAALVPWPVTTEAPSLDGAGWLLAAGGGTLLDRAKLLRAGRPGVKLALLPTLWGSGAQATSIAVSTGGQGKVVRMEPELLADLVVERVELGRSAPAELARHESGDAWSHALEGFFSPISTPATRVELASVLQAMAALPLAFAPEWYELGARAARGQAKSSVGLAHGIAHVLEQPLGWGHAKLCSTFLLPAMRYLRERGPSRWSLLAEHDIPVEGVWRALGGLDDREAFQAALPALRAHWLAVVRDPCTRTNAALVRPSDLDFLVSCVDE